MFRDEAGNEFLATLDGEDTLSPAEAEAAAAPVLQARLKESRYQPVGRLTYLRKYGWPFEAS